MKLKKKRETKSRMTGLSLRVKYFKKFMTPPPPQIKKKQKQNKTKKKQQTNKKQYKSHIKCIIVLPTIFFFFHFILTSFFPSNRNNSQSLENGKNPFKTMTRQMFSTDQRGVTQIIISRSLNYFICNQRSKTKGHLFS